VTTDQTVASQAASSPESQASESNVSENDRAILSLFEEQKDEAASDTDSQADGETDGEQSETDSEEANQTEPDFFDVLTEEGRKAIEAAAAERAVAEHQVKASESATEAEAKRKEQLTREQRQQRFQAQAPSLRAALLSDGVPEQRVNEYMSWFTTFNRDVYQDIAVGLTDILFGSLKGSLPEDERETFSFDGLGGDIEKVLDDFGRRKEKHSRNGYFSKAAMDEAVALAKLETFKKIQEDPSLLNRRSGPKPRSGGRSTSRDRDGLRRSNDGKLDIGANLAHIAATSNGV
jgi:hypothetical protein